MQRPELTSPGPGAFPEPPPTTLNIEKMFDLGARHIERLIDPQGRTYFNVFKTIPPEAVTDWPDFVDLPARYWEAIALIEPILGHPVAAKERVRAWLFKHIETDGLAYRPDSPISYHTAELFDQSRLLYALVTWAMHDPTDVQVRQALVGLAGGLLRLATFREDFAFIREIGIYFGGTLIRPMLQAGIVLDRPDLIDFAGALARGLFHHSSLFAADGGFKGHVHGALSAIAGTLAFAIKTADAKLLGRARTAFDFARAFSTDFGFVPEHAQHVDDVIACETCAIMDYLDGALLLARHVDPAYWDIVEKTTRNHLWESQIRDASWLGPQSNHDEEDIIRTDLHDRLIGAFAGWSAPHCTLANHECLWNAWVRTDEKRPLYVNKVRALQNCCAGAGIRAAYQVWSNIVTCDASTVSVNLSLDRADLSVHVTSFIPFQGRVKLVMQRAAILRWRRPIDCGADDVQVTIDGKTAIARADGPFLNFGYLSSGAVIVLDFPLQERSETVTLGNAGHQMYRFKVTWRGDTVLAIVPDPNNPPTSYTHRMDKHMPSYYHTSGPGPLYQRQTWLPTHRLAASSQRVVSVHVDWYGLSEGYPIAAKRL